MTLGGRGDSFTEYLLKEFLLTGEVDPFLYQHYMLASAGIRRQLAVRHEPRASTGSKPMLAYLQQLVRTSGDGGSVAEFNNGGTPESPPPRGATWSPVAKMDHLACFAPGLLALGDMELGDPRDVSSDGRIPIRPLYHELMRSCVVSSLRTSTGVAPEISRFDAFSSQAGGMVDDEKSLHGLLRPEVSESLLYLYRITGDPQYREWGGHILDALLLEAQTSDGAFAPLRTVNPPPGARIPGGRYVGTMPSFVVAETLKYLLLLFSDSNVVDLSTHVFNTEGHLLPKFGQTAGGEGGDAAAAGGGARRLGRAERALLRCVYE